MLKAKELERPVSRDPLNVKITSSMLMLLFLQPIILRMIITYYSQDDNEWIEIGNDNLAEGLSDLKIKSLDTKYVC